MNKKFGYLWHYHEAKEKWMTLNEECCKQIPLDLYENYYSERQYIEEHFDEMEQVKLVYDYELGTHLLKIKWENFSCWWADCKCLGMYYCVMLPIDDVHFKTPYALATEAKK